MKRHSFASGYIDTETKWRRSLKHWMVQSPKYEYTIHVLEDGSGPTEETCDIVEVQAITKSEARIIGLKQMRKEFPKGYLNELSPWENPFKGMVIEEYPEEDEMFSDEEIAEMVVVQRSTEEQSRIDAVATY